MIINSKTKLRPNQMVLYSLVIILSCSDITLQQQPQNDTDDDEYKRLERGYPSAPGTWNSKNTVQSYGWNSPHPVDLCNQCIGLNYNRGYHMKDYLPPSAPTVTNFPTKPPYAISTTISLSFPPGNNKKYEGITDHSGMRQPISPWRNTNNNEYRGNGYDNFSPEWKYREMMDMKFGRKPQQANTILNKLNSAQSDDDGWQLISSSTGRKPKYNVQAYDRVWDNRKVYPVQVDGYSHRDRTSNRDGTIPSWKLESMQGGIVQSWIGGRPQPSLSTYSSSKERPSSYYYDQNRYDYGVQSHSDGYIHSSHNNNNKYNSPHDAINKKKLNQNIVYYEYNLDEKKLPPSSSSIATDPIKTCVDKCKQQYLPPSSDGGASIYRTDQSAENYYPLPDEDNYRWKYGNLHHNDDYYSKGNYPLRRYGEYDFQPAAVDVGNYIQSKSDSRDANGFKPLDETTKGIAGWDGHGKGHYFATDDISNGAEYTDERDHSNIHPWSLTIYQQQTTGSPPISRPWYVSNYRKI